MSASPTPARWLIPALCAVAGAGAHTAIWLALDRLGVGGGLSKFGWPFGSLLTITVLGAFSGAVFGRAIHARRELRKAAADDPVEPPDESDESDDAPEPDFAALPDLPAFAGRVAMERRSAEKAGGVTADVFDLTTEESDGDGGTARVTRTFVLLPADGLPAFELAPQRFARQVLSWVGAGGLRFDPAAAGSADGAAVVKRFEATFRLHPVSVETMMSGRVEADDDAVRRVFRLGVLRAALRRADWRVQSHGGHLAFWAGPERLGPGRRARLVSDAGVLRTALLAAHAGAAHGPVLPAPPGAVSSERQAARFQAAVLGALLGGFAGFFVGAVLESMAFFSQPMGERMQGNTGIGARFILSILVGVVGGGAIGCLLPLRRPLLVKPADPRREKVVGCAGMIGLFGGFMGGGIAGAVLGEVIGLKIDDAPMRAGLFFGGMGVGAIGGLILLPVATNYIYKWVTGRWD